MSEGSWSWRVTWLDVLTWILHGVIQWSGKELFEWAAFSPAQVAVLLTLGLAVWYAREESQHGWNKLDDIGDMAGPAGVTAWGWWIAL